MRDGSDDRPEIFGAAEQDRGVVAEVAGLAPELQGAKKGQGEAPVLSAPERFTAYDVDALRGARRARGELAVHPAAPAARPARRHRGLRRRRRPTTVEGARGRDRRAATTRASARAGRPGRPGRRAAAWAASARPLVDAPRRHALAEPVTITVTGPAAGAVAASHLVIRTSPQPRPRSCSCSAARHAGRQHRDRGRPTAPGSRCRHVEEWADDAVHVGAPPHRGRPGRHAARTAVDLRRRPGAGQPDRRYGGPGGDAELIGLYFADAGPAPGAPAVRRSRCAALQVARDVQGRAAGRRRAHGVDRRRADPQGRGGHRHLRDEPQPGAHHGRARRLGAEPGDRDRRDRRGRARQRHRPLRRRAAVLPAVPRHPRGVARAWSSAASSARCSARSPFPSCGSGWRRPSRPSSPSRATSERSTTPPCQPWRSATCTSPSPPTTARTRSSGAST